MIFYKFTKVTTILLILLFIFVIKFMLNCNFALAQVNENSKSDPSDEQYYELTDLTIQIEPDNLQSNLENNINNIEDLSVSTNLFNTSQSFTNDPSILSIKLDDLPTTVSILNGLAFVPTILSLVALSLSPNSIFLLIGTIFRKKRKTFGLIYDATTKKIIPLVKIRVFYADSTKVIFEQLSDFKGRYGFPLTNGNYRIEIKHPGYQKYIDNINIQSTEEFFAKDILLPQEDANANTIASATRKINNLIIKNSLILTLVGLLFAIAGFLIRQTSIEILLIIFYLTTLAIYLYIQRNFFRQNYWGEVVSIEKNIRISGAIVRLFAINSTMVDTQISNQNGKFGFLVSPGEYYLFVYAPGYKLSAKNKHFTPDKNMIKIKLNQNKDEWLKIQVLMEPYDNYYNVQNNNYKNAQNISPKFGVI